jgi:DNA adenine methylase
MKTPITYYGGKQKLVKEILPRIPKHNLYAEPFFGGGAIFFSKPKSNVEVINDTNTEVINFYRVVQNDFVSLEKEIRISLHSRRLHKDASVIYNNPHMFSDVKRAWAFWTLATMGFASKIDGSFGYDIKKGTTSKKVSNKREAFTEEYAYRLQEVQIECTDALRIITSRDTKDAFFYCDPPYYNSDCGHYDGYTLDDFELLLKKLSKIEGKFMLSSYPSPILTEYTKQFGWHTKQFQQEVTIANANSKKGRKPKIEVITTNYPIK